MVRTPEQIRTVGLDALRRSLGVAGMIRFIQQFERGKGDYAKDRRQWVDRITMEDLEALITEYRKKETASASKRRSSRAAAGNGKKRNRRNTVSRRRSA